MGAYERLEVGRTRNHAHLKTATGGIQVSEQASHPSSGHISRRFSREPGSFLSRVLPPGVAP